MRNLSFGLTCGILIGVFGAVIYCHRNDKPETVEDALQTIQAHENHVTDMTTARDHYHAAAKDSVRIIDSTHIIIRYRYETRIRNIDLIPADSNFFLFRAELDTAAARFR